MKERSVYAYLIHCPICEDVTVHERVIGCHGQGYVCTLCKKHRYTPQTEPPAAASEEEGEICQRCGKAYELVWHAPDKLWAEVTGFKDGNGLLCPNCFAILVWEHSHTFLYWSCDIRLYPRHALFHRLRHQLRRLRLEAWLRKQKKSRKAEWK